MKKLVYLLLVSLAIGSFSCVSEKQKLAQQQLLEQQKAYDSLYSDIEKNDSLLIYKEAGNCDYIFTNRPGKYIWAFIRIKKPHHNVEDICLVLNSNNGFTISNDTTEAVLKILNSDTKYKTSVTTLLINPTRMYTHNYAVDKSNLWILQNEELDSFLKQLNDSSFLEIEIPSSVFNSNYGKEYDEILNSNPHIFSCLDSLDIKNLILVRDYYYKFKKLDELVKPK